MIIKRYSQKQFTFTGRDLVEKLYSEGWKVEQKEYGLKSAAISGIKKVGKLIAKKLDDSSKLDSEKLKKINESLKSVAKDRNPEVLKNIGKDAKKSNIKILNGKKKLSSSEKFFRKRFDKTKSWEKKSSDVSTKEKIDLTRSKALKLLKAAGASKDELKNAKEELDLSLKTYKIGRNKAIKDSISKRLKGFKKTKTM